MTSQDPEDDERDPDRELTAALGPIDHVLRLTLGWFFVLAMGLGLYQLGGMWRIAGALVLAALAVLTFLNIAARFSEKD